MSVVRYKSFSNLRARCNSNNVENACAICPKRFLVNDYIVIHDCGHAFHLTCMDTWNHDNPVCIVCKARALKKTWAGSDDAVAMMEAERGYIDY